MGVEEDQCSSKPQLLFKDTIDNSDSPFQHKISNKPNALIPLQQNNSHPYEYEITKLVFSPDQYASEREAILPQSMENTQYIFIDTFEQFQELAHMLDACKEFAIDLEQHSFRSYQGFTCLMQISTRAKDYLIDTIALRERVHLLNSSFTNPSIVKVLHGADDDVPWLQRDLGLYIVNLFDTKHAARALQYKLSLFDLLTKYCPDYSANKSLQRVDWRVRPLPQHMVEYARSDTHFLLYLYDILHNDLVKLGTASYLMVLEKGKETCLRQYEKKKLLPNFKNDANFGRGYKEYTSLYSVQFTAEHDFLIKKLYEWRDKVARIEDEGVSFVMQKPFLFGLVHHAIDNETALDDFTNKYPALQEGNRVSPLLPKYKQELLDVILQAKHAVTNSSVEEPKKLSTQVLTSPVAFGIPKFYKSGVPWNPSLAKNILRDYFLNGLKIGEPVYETREQGPAHQKMFTIQVRIPVPSKEDSQPSFEVVQAQGSKKKNVETEIAQKACVALIERGLLLVSGYQLATSLTPNNSNNSTSSAMDLEFTTTPSKTAEDNSFEYKGHLCSVEQAKAILQHHYQIACKKHPEYINQAIDSSQYNGTVKVQKGQKVWISKVLVPGEAERFGYGESASKRDSEKIAAFQALRTLASENTLQVPKTLITAPNESKNDLPFSSPRKRKTSEDSSSILSSLFSSPTQVAKPEDKEPVQFVPTESQMVCAKCGKDIVRADSISFEGAHMLLLTDLASCQNHAKSKNSQPLIIGNLRYELTQQETARKYKPFKIRCSECLAGVGSIVMQGRDMKACMSASDVMFQTPTQKLTTNQVRQAMTTTAPMETSPKRVKTEAARKQTSSVVLEEHTKLQDRNSVFLYELSFEPFEEVEDPVLDWKIFTGFYLICHSECFVRTLVVQKQKNTKRKKSAIAKLNPLGTLVLNRNELIRARTIHSFFLAKFLKQQKKWNYTSLSQTEIPFVLSLPRFKCKERNLSILEHMNILEDLMKPQAVTPLLQQVLQKHHTDYQQVREAVLSNPNSEEAKMVTQEIDKTLFKRCIKTRYNDLCYFASEADFTQSPLSNTQKQKKQENAENTSVEYETYLEYYQAKGTPITDTTQPLVVSDFKKITGEIDEIPDPSSLYNKLYLIPEHCDIIQFTFEMYFYGLFLGHIFQHMEETDQHINSLVQWVHSIGYSIDNKLLLKQAFCHPSFAHEKETPQSSNAILEYLGDAVLETVFSVYLFMKNREATEGMLCADRQPFIRNENLQFIASRLGMHQHIQMAKKQTHILEDNNALFRVNADALEAFIAVMYLDKGMDEVCKFVIENFSLDKKNIPVAGAVDVTELSESLELSPEDEEKFKQLENNIGIRFNNRKLLKQAFTHSSALPDDAPLTCSYERLEWLGDSFLKLVTTLFLYFKYPHHAEGTLTTLRIAYIMNENLAKCAFKLGLQNLVHVSEDLANQLNKMDTDESQTSQKIYGDIMESLIGAVFLEKGFEATKSFVEKFVIEASAVSEGSGIDPKGLLQHWISKHNPASSLNYKVLSESNGVCEVAVLLDGEIKAKASGVNFLKASKKAAEMAYQSLVDSNQQNPV